MKKKKPKMEFRYYKIPADSHMLPLTGKNLKQCYGVEVDYLHFHNHMEIGYCYYGEGTLSLENTKHEFQGGMFSIQKSGSVQPLFIGLPGCLLSPGMPGCLFGTVGLLPYPGPLPRAGAGFFQTTAVY